MKRPRILIADDHVLILDGFRNLLQPSYAVVGTVEDGDALLEAAVRLKPDLIILDITMPVLSGIQAARAVRAHLPRVKLLFVTMHTSPTYLKAALEAGADGYALSPPAVRKFSLPWRVSLKGTAMLRPTWPWTDRTN